MQENFKKLWNV